MTHVAPRSRIRLGLVAAAIGLALGSSSCTLIIDRSSDQCESDGECAGFPGTTCSAEGLCVEPPCSSTRECLDLFGDEHVCNHRTERCASLRSRACTNINGDYTSDDAFFIGSVAPLEGEDAATGQVEQNAIKLALHDFKQTSNGLPPRVSGGATRPIVLVGCNDDSDGDEAVSAAQHLVKVGVPAIIGAAYSGITIRVATEVTIPNQVLLISPSATSVAITDLADQELVWRTAPSDVFQARAMTAYVPRIEAKLGDPGGPLDAPTARMKLAILHKGDTYGSGLAKAVQDQLVMNDEPVLAQANVADYLRVDYGNPDDASNPTRYEQTVEEALGLRPHVVLLLGTAEAVREILPGIEEGWAEPAYKPQYVLSDGTVRDLLWNYVASNDDLRRRLTGTIPGTINPLFDGFRSDYTTLFHGMVSPDVFGAAGAYDATYLLAYSAASIGAGAIDGPALAKGLKKLVPTVTGSASVDVGTGGINGTFMRLSQGESVDFTGASGPLDFNVATGEAPSDIQIWCLPADAAGMAQSAIFSGLYLKAGSDDLIDPPSGSACD